MNMLPHLKLSISAEKFLISFQEDLSIKQSGVLVIDRITRDVNVKDKTSITVEVSETRYIYGLVGIIHLLAGPYLVIIKKALKVGELNRQAVWKIEEVEIIPFHKGTWHLTDEQISCNESYLSMLKSVFNTPSFYYSLTFDITHTLQRLGNVGPDFMSLPLFERADPRFVWNQTFLKDFIGKPGVERYLIPIIHGFVSFNSIFVKGKSFTWNLISRRSCQRAGTRLFFRGVDEEGNVANFVETEQIVEYENARSSFVQTRGSIPLFWNQYPNLRYKPQPELSQFHNHIDALQKHLDHSILNYGRVVIINLINQRGPEHALEKELTRLIKQLNNNLIRYEAFDFHHECRNMRWDKLSILMNRIKEDIGEVSYFSMSPEGSVLSLQDGVFRVNCIDSLDRTNVVQGLIAKISLEEQLMKFSIFAPGDKIEDYPFDDVYRNVWADNADICSIEYAGTGALKTDFTRTGKRTKNGLLRDGINSMIRYYKNNFTDGFRQDSIDLFLGNYKINENEGKMLPCPLSDKKKDWKYLLLPLILLGAISMLFFSLVLPAEYTSETFMYLIFWSGMISITVSVILYYGTEFVDFPKLCEIKPRTST